MVSSEEPVLTTFGVTTELPLTVSKAGVLTEHEAGEDLDGVRALCLKEAKSFCWSWLEAIERLN